VNGRGKSGARLAPVGVAVEGAVRELIAHVVVVAVALSELDDDVLDDELEESEPEELLEESELDDEPALSELDDDVELVDPPRLSVL
jgi:hypothetical protein